MRYALTFIPVLAAASPMLQVGTIHKDAAPILSSTQAKEVPNSYMVVFKKHVKESNAKEHHEWVQSVHSKSSNERMELRKRSQFPVTADVFDGLKHTYDIIGGMAGYSGHFDDETIEAIRRHPDVSSSLFLYTVQTRFAWRRHDCLQRFSLAVANGCCLEAQTRDRRSSSCAASVVRPAWRCCGDLQRPRLTSARPGLISASAPSLSRAPRDDIQVLRYPQCSNANA
jgi:hypothetical protein